MAARTIDTFFRRTGAGNQSKSNQHERNKPGDMPIKAMPEAAANMDANRGIDSSDMMNGMQTPDTNMKDIQTRTQHQPAAIENVIVQPSEVDFCVLMNEDGPAAANVTPAGTQKKRALGANGKQTAREDGVAKRAKQSSPAADAIAPSPQHICPSSSSESEYPTEGADNVGLADSTKPSCSHADNGDAVTGQPQPSNSQVQHSTSRMPNNCQTALNNACSAGPSGAASTHESEDHAGADGGQQQRTYSVSDLTATIDETRFVLSQEWLLEMADRPQNTPLSSDQVAAFVEGRTCTLTDLVAQLAGLAGDSPTAMETKASSAELQAAPSTPTATTDHGPLRMMILDLAARKAYGAKEGVPEGLAAADDADTDALWFWELRDIRKALQPTANSAAMAGSSTQGASASKPGDKKTKDAAAAALATKNRKFAELFRKRRKELHERLVAATGLRDVMTKIADAQHAADTAAAAGKRGPATSKTLQSKAAKLTAKLDKLPTVSQIESALETGMSALGEAVSERQAALSARNKAREEAAAARQAEKEAKKQEKQQEKEAKKQEKEEAEARKLAEKDTKAAEKAAQAIGFTSTKTLQKSKAMMANFFKKASKTPGTTGGHTAAAAAGANINGLASPSGIQPRALAGVLQAQGTDLPVPMDTINGAAGVTTPAAGGCAVLQQSLSALIEQQRKELDLVLPSGTVALQDSELQALRTSNKQRWKEQACVQRRPVKGLPPSWARRPGPQPSLHERCVALWGEGYQVAAVRVLRRKLIAFSTNVRPPFYGSFSKHSTKVSGRKPWARDELLDYEVDSDEEWEEEPEGTDLEADSEGEDVSECRGGEGDEDEPGFVVDDGYLSGDEGVQLDDMEIDSGRCVMGNGTTDARIATLEAGIHRALRSNKPLLLCRLPGVQCEPHATLDSKLLHVLTGQVLRPGVHITCPKEADIYTPPVREDAAMTDIAGGVGQGAAGPVDPNCLSNTAGGGTATAATHPNSGPGKANGGRGRSSQPFPETLQDELQRFLCTTKEKALDKVVQLFHEQLTAHNNTLISADPVTAHKLTAVPSKKAIKEKIRSIATYTAGRGWVLHPQGGTTTPSSRQLQLPAASPDIQQLHNKLVNLLSPWSTSLNAGTAPTPLAREAAAQLLGAAQDMQGNAAQQPAGAPTPWPTPGVTIPAMGLAANVGSSAATHAQQEGALLALSNSAVQQHPAWRRAPAHVRPAVGGTPVHGTAHSSPVTPIPCALERVQSGQAVMPMQAMPLAAASGAAAGCCTPLNTPVSYTTPAASGMAKTATKPGSRLQASAVAGGGLDLSQLAARMEGLREASEEKENVEEMVVS